MNELIRDVEFRGQALRIPYPADLFDSFKIDNVTWKVLIDTIFPGASSAEPIIMALAYCRRRSLDIMKRPVHIVQMYSTGAGRMIDTIWPSIAELRTTAFRTGQYIGCDEAEFGPVVKDTFEWSSDKGGPKKATVEYPEWCRMTVRRVLNGNACVFVGPKAYWKESYARISRNIEAPNEMWRKRPAGQIEKCAEAAALRRAFPEELGNEYSAEEMEGQILFDQQQATAPQRRVAPPPPPPSAIEQKPAIPLEVEVKTGHEPVAAQAETPRRAPPPPAQSVPKQAEPDWQAILDKHREAVEAATDADSLDDAWTFNIAPHEKIIPSWAYEAASKCDDERRGQIE